MDAAPWSIQGALVDVPQLGSAAQASLSCCLLLSWLGVLKPSCLRDGLKEEQSPQELGQSLLCAARDL